MVGLLGLIAVLGSLALVGCAPELGAASRGWTPVAARDGLVYVVTPDGEVEALVDSGAEGVSLKWTYSGPDNSIQGAYHPPVVADNLIYVSAIDGFLYALEKETGTLGDAGWRSPGGQDGNRRALIGGPALDTNLGMVVVGSEDHNLYAYDAATGQEQWRFTTGDKIWSTPVIHNGTVYFGSHDHNVYALDAATGEEKWRFTTGAAVVARPLVWRDMVVIGSFDRKLYALDIDNGNKVWEFEASNWFWAGAVANSSTVFAPSMDGNVYALGQGGTLLWERSMGAPIVSAPVLLPRGLVVASQEGVISTFNPSVGDLVIAPLSLDPAEVKAPIFALPVDNTALSQSGIQDSQDDQRESVFVGAQNGTVRRIQVKSGQNVVWCFDTERDEICQ